MGMPAKPDDPAPGEDVFTDEDLLPNSEDLARERVARRRDGIDRAAAIVAVLAFGMFAGGMIALGATAAPVVFKLPHPLSGNTMGEAFSRFDSMAIGCALVGLGAEVVRTVVSLKTPPRGWAPRARRYLAILLACGTLFTGLQLSPQIMAAYQAGVRRNVGSEGATLEQTHKTAELVGKIDVGLASMLVALHMLTLGGARRDEDDEEVLAPLPPGPSNG